MLVLADVLLRMCSPPAIDLSLSGLLQAWLLSFDATWVVLEQPEVLERASGPHIVGLEGPGNRWNAGFTLPSQTATADADVDIDHASVRSHHERIEHAVPLLRAVEVLDERLSIDLMRPVPALTLTIARLALRLP